MVRDSQQPKTEVNDMAHLHFIEDSDGEVVDQLVFCSDWCHKEHTNDSYKGWNGCHEISTTEPCTFCGDNVEGLNDDL